MVKARAGKNALTDAGVREVVERVDNRVKDYLKTPEGNKAKKDQVLTFLRGAVEREIANFRKNAVNRDLNDSKKAGNKKGTKQGLISSKDFLKQYKGFTNVKTPKEYERSVSSIGNKQLNSVQAANKEDLKQLIYIFTRHQLNFERVRRDELAGRVQKYVDQRLADSKISVSKAEGAAMVKNASNEEMELFKKWGNWNYMAENDFKSPKMYQLRAHSVNMSTLSKMEIHSEQSMQRCMRQMIRTQLNKIGNDRSKVEAAVKSAIYKAFDASSYDEGKKQFASCFKNTYPEEKKLFQKFNKTISMYTGAYDRSNKDNLVKAADTAIASFTKIRTKEEYYKECTKYKADEVNKMKIKNEMDAETFCRRKLRMKLVTGPCTKKQIQEYVQKEILPVLRNCPHKKEGKEWEKFVNNVVVQERLLNRRLATSPAPQASVPQYTSTQDYSKNVKEISKIVKQPKYFQIKNETSFQKFCHHVVRYEMNQPSCRNMTSTQFKKHIVAIVEHRCKDSGYKKSSPEIEATFERIYREEKKAYEQYSPNKDEPVRYMKPSNSTSSPIYEAPAPAPESYHSPAPAPEAAQAPAPVTYSAPAQNTTVSNSTETPNYEAPAPVSYEKPDPAPVTYSAPAQNTTVSNSTETPNYEAPAPVSYEKPAPAPVTYNAPAPAPVQNVTVRNSTGTPKYEAPAPAPAPVSYDEPAPAPAPVSYDEPAPESAPAPAPVAYDTPAQNATFSNSTETPKYEAPAPAPAPVSYETPQASAPAPVTYETPQAPAPAPVSYETPPPEYKTMPRPNCTCKAYERSVKKLCFKKIQKTEVNDEMSLRKYIKKLIRWKLNQGSYNRVYLKSGSKCRKLRKHLALWAIKYVRKQCKSSGYAPPRDVLRKVMRGCVNKEFKIYRKYFRATSKRYSSSIEKCDKSFLKSIEVKDKKSFISYCKSLFRYKLNKGGYKMSHREIMEWARKKITAKCAGSGYKPEDIRGIVGRCLRWEVKHFEKFTGKRARCSFDSKKFKNPKQYENAVKNSEHSNLEKFEILSRSDLFNYIRALVRVNINRGQCSSIDSCIESVKGEIKERVKKSGFDEVRRSEWKSKVAEIARQELHSFRKFASSSRPSATSTPTVRESGL